MEHTPTLHELAVAWCELSADEQAVFFTKIYDLKRQWITQLRAISQSEKMTDDARWLMSQIGKHAYLGPEGETCKPTQ